MVPDPENLKKALAEYDRQSSVGMARIACDFHLNYKTFWRHVQGYQSMREAHEPFQKLSKAKKDQIVELCAFAASL